MVAGDYWQIGGYERGAMYPLQYVNRIVLLCFVLVVFLYFSDVIHLPIESGDALLTLGHL